MNNSYGLVSTAIMILAAFGLIAALQTAIPDGPLQTAPLEGPLQKAVPEGPCMGHPAGHPSSSPL